jgi:hypothetical protein
MVALVVNRRLGSRNRFVVKTVNHAPTLRIKQVGRKVPRGRFRPSGDFGELSDYKDIVPGNLLAEMRPALGKTNFR